MYIHLRLRLDKNEILLLNYFTFENVTKLLAHLKLVLLDKL